ncbi:MAG: MFS transporter [Oscillospiraceae bacterium]|jgi:predicted MFS family arabinose efflux permease
MKNETKLFNKYFVLTLLIGLCINIGQSVTNNSVSVYIDSLSFSTGFTGLIGVPYAACAIAARIISGYYADHRGRRFVMIIGCLLFAASSLFFGYVRSAAALLIFRSLQGAGYAFSFTGATAANVDVTPAGKEKEGIGIFWIPLAIAIAISGELVLRLSADGTYTKVFLTAGVVLAMGIVFSVLCGYEKKPAGEMRSEEQTAYMGLAKFVEPRALKAASIMLCFAIGVSSVTAFIMLFAQSRQYQNTGLFFTMGAVFMFIGNLASAGLHKKLGAVTTLCTAFAAFGVMITATAFSENEIVFLITGAVSGYIQGIASPVLCSLVMEQLPADRRGAGSSTLYMMLDIGVGIGSFLWGIVIKGTGGYAAVYCGAGFFSLLAIILTIMFYAGRRKQAATAEYY